MKGVLILRDFEEFDYYGVSIGRGYSIFDYELHLHTTLDESYKTITGNLDNLDSYVEDTLEMIDDDPELVDLVKDFQNNPKKYLENIEYIIMDFEMEKIVEFLKKNPELQGKKLVFFDMKLDGVLLNEIETYFKDNTENIYIRLGENDEFIGFSEYKATIEAINKMIQDIKRFNFSPMEAIMYAYDIAKNRVYIAEDKEESAELSRGISSVLLGEKIVCLGYARIFKIILDKIGIDNKIVCLYNKKDAGHARNEIYVKDPKYNINGVYFFDATWDSKKNAADKTYLLSYKYFAMTKTQIDSIDGGKIIDKDFPYFSPDIMWEFEEIAEEEGIENTPDYIAKSINHMSRIITGKSINVKLESQPFIPNEYRLTTQKVIKRIYPLLEYFDKPLSAEVLLKVLYNVRKNQYYSNTEKFPFDINTFYKTMLYSKWRFENSEEEQELLDFLGKEVEKAIKVEQFLRFSKKNELERKIEQIRLTNVLRNISENDERKSGR